jgi:large subunit ribosomal protein L14
MIQEQTRVRIADNSGGKWGQCIKVLGGSGKKVGRVGDRIVVVIKSVRSGLGAESTKAKVKKSGIYHAVVVRTKPEIGENGVVLINKKKEPLGTRAMGPISAKLLRKGWLRIASLSPLLI